MCHRRSSVNISKTSLLAVLTAALIACATSETSVRADNAEQGGSGGTTAGSGSGPAGGGSGGATGGLTGISGSTTFGGAGTAGANATGGAAGAGNGGSAGGAGTAGTGVGGTGGQGTSGAGDGGAPSAECAAAALSERATWTATASHYGGDVPANAIDASTATRFATGKAQAGDEWLQVDFGVSVALTEIRLFTSSSNDYPRAYEVRVSDTSQDDAATPVAQGTGSADLAVPFGNVVTGRYLYVKQTGTLDSGTSWWSLHDLTVTCN